jgi:hypothetical protein
MLHQIKSVQKKLRDSLISIFETEPKEVGTGGLSSGDEKLEISNVELEAVELLKDVE